MASAWQLPEKTESKMCLIESTKILWAVSRRNMERIAESNTAIARADCRECDFGELASSPSVANDLTQISKQSFARIC